MDQVLVPVPQRNGTLGLVLVQFLEKKINSGSGFGSRNQNWVPILGNLV